MIYINFQITLLLIVFAPYLDSTLIKETGYVENFALDCSSVTCDLAMSCLFGYELKQVDGFCCPVCLCKPCEQNLECSDGFELKEIPKKINECCNSYKCLPDNKRNSRMNRNSHMCSAFNCTDKKYTHLTKNSKCPIDSLEILASREEKLCCGVARLCICDQCSSETEMNDWCKIAGNNFKATLIEKGNNTPGNCCDAHICHSTNFTCQYNGDFYPNNFEWKHDACTECKCELGYIKCSNIKCPKLDCEVTKILKGECCPVCTNQCLSLSLPEKIFEPMEKWYEEKDPCIQCKCLNGKKDCLTESCGQVNCHNPVKLLGVCCLFCPAKKNCTKDCNKLICKHGYEIDDDGCDICKCYEPNLMEEINKTIEKEKSFAIDTAVLGLIIIMVLLFISSILLICVYRSNNSAETNKNCSKFKKKIENCKEKGLLNHYTTQSNERTLMLDRNFYQKNDFDYQDSNSSLYDTKANIKSMRDYLNVQNENTSVENKTEQPKIGSICYL